MIPSGCDKGGGELVDGVGINIYFGSVNLPDVVGCEYVEWRAFGVNFPAIEHDHPIAVLSS